ncbi:galactokinase [Candidatus Woesebacteria bacterium GWC1_42_13]|uniref:Galactokinase n=1 Tax=Candidatus Woesebacteria bacterium GWC1_42_13 TaxID=1802475 RepID=A0A1F7WYK3_9BACT|nr:MAG: galactokinase [Candidatus Woesebacteria bacterium GWC1_42_13]
MIFVRAPFRIPLGGGGTDLPSYYSKFGGALISAAINRYMFITINRLIVEKQIRVKYAQTEIVNHVREVKHDLVREALRLTNITDSIEINSVADLPAGVGMGSSGSYLVALLKALHTLKNEYVLTKDLAEEACKIEIEKLGRPVGKQDQYIAAFGGITKLNIRKNGGVRVKRLALKPAFVRDLENSLLIFYTGIKREEKQILKKQNKATRHNNKRVIENLHLIKSIGLKIERALIRNDIDAFGRLMHEHWMAKRNLSSGVSSSRIDHLYQLGIKNGALGGKIMGAGGGGFLLFCCPEGKTQVRKAIEKEGLTELFFHFDMEGTKVIADF